MRVSVYRLMRSRGRPWQWTAQVRILFASNAGEEHKHRSTWICSDTDCIIARLRIRHVNTNTPRIDFANTARTNKHYSFSWPLLLSAVACGGKENPYTRMWGLFAEDKARSCPSTDIVRHGVREEGLTRPTCPSPPPAPRHPALSALIHIYHHTTRFSFVFIHMYITIPKFRPQEVR